MTSFTRAAFLDYSLKIYTVTDHNIDVLKRKKGKSIEDMSQTQLCYEIILQNIYFDYLNITRNFGLKLSLKNNTRDSWKELPPLLGMLYYSSSPQNKKIEIEVSLFSLDQEHDQTSCTNTQFYCFD